MLPLTLPAPAANLALYITRILFLLLPELLITFSRMSDCWEEYLWKVHQAVPLDPWSNSLQLLDILIQRGSSWLPAWLSSKTSTMTRAGSMLGVGLQSKEAAVAKAWKVNVEEPITAGLTMLENDQPIINSEGAIDLFKVETMADIQASLKSSTSLLASIAAGGSASAQFDAKGSKTLNCTVADVKSHRVILDTLMKMVSERSWTGEPAYWRPDTSQPQLQWSSRRGQTLWVVTEILYANKIKIEADNQVQANGKASVAATTAKPDVGVNGAYESDGVWTVTAPTQLDKFPFAFRMKKLDYDASGTLRSSKPTLLRRNNSNLSKRTIKFSSMHMDELHRSSSVSRILP